MSEQSSDMDQESIDESELSCYLSFQLTKDDDLIFDAIWDDKEALTKLAQIIYLIQNSDFIIKNIKEMETINSEDALELEKIIEDMNNMPAIFPLEVYNDK